MRHDSSARELRGGAALRRGMRDERDVVAAGVRPGAELGRQQRVGRLIGRQVRRDVADAHRSRQAVARTVAAVSVRPRSARGTRRTSSARRRDRASRTSGLGRAGRRTRRARPRPVVRTAADDRLAGMKEEIQDRRAAADDLPAKRDHVFGRAVRRTQPADVRDAQQAQHALASCRATAPARTSARRRPGRGGSAPQRSAARAARSGLDASRRRRPG